MRFWDLYLFFFYLETIIRESPERKLLRRWMDKWKRLTSCPNFASRVWSAKSRGLKVNTKLHMPPKKRFCSDRQHPSLSSRLQKRKKGPFKLQRSQLGCFDPFLSVFSLGKWTGEREWEQIGFDRIEQLKLSLFWSRGDSFRICWDQIWWDLKVDADRDDDRVRSQKVSSSLLPKAPIFQAFGLSLWPQDTQSLEARRASEPSLMTVWTSHLGQYLFKQVSLVATLNEGGYLGVGAFFCVFSPPAKLGFHVDFGSFFFLWFSFTFERSKGEQSPHYSGPQPRLCSLSFSLKVEAADH